MRSGADERSGLRATPLVTMRNGRGSISATMPRFWQNFPQAIEVTGNELSLHLFPAEYASAHEIQGGEQKTHDVFVSFDGDTVTSEPLAWCRSRLVAHAEPEWYCRTDALPYLTVASEPASVPHRRLVDAAIDGADTFERKREVVDEYGWRHFGEIYGDHEGVRHTGPHPLVSHYNNQYDPVCGFARQFFSTGDVRWWTQMEELASPRGGHRHLPHRRRQVGVQPRAVLAHLSLRRCRHCHASHVSAGAAMARRTAAARPESTTTRRA